MADFDEIPEQIRSLLNSLPEGAEAPDPGDVEPPAAWEELAAAYGRLCREANERLRRCADYLRRGMRSEAVHLAACQPELLALTAALQFKELPRWSRLCGRWRLPVPPRLRTESVAELASAAGAETRLEPLLARHRVLGLGKALTRDRLEVLRLLAGRDEANPCWVENLRLLEAKRLTELRTEAEAAVRGKNRPVLERLNDELTSGMWRLEVPEGLREGVRRALEALRLKAALAELNHTLAELTAAYKAGDSDRCDALLGRWQAVVEAGRVTLPPEMQERVRPIVAWLGTQERREGMAQKRQTMQTGLAETEQVRRRFERRGRVAAIAAGVGLAGVIGTAAYLYLRHIGR